ncbi:unnamed protein product [Mytilus edulis]|uniref:CCHC-type domain-containing protein n=1 Tax=Mytilus edulis TaxID=6550 RepID=A0A8S3UAX3_MYTED|nr:unnamed protein product [Mytilus edulis]
MNGGTYPFYGHHQFLKTTPTICYYTTGNCIHTSFNVIAVEDGITPIIEKPPEIISPCHDNGGLYSICQPQIQTEVSWKITPDTQPSYDNEVQEQSPDERRGGGVEAVGGEKPGASTQEDEESRTRQSIPYSRRQQQSHRLREPMLKKLTNTSLFSNKQEEEFSTMRHIETILNTKIKDMAAKIEYENHVVRANDRDETVGWNELKAQLGVRFSEVSDPQHAFDLLSKIKQKHGENVPIFAERLHNLAEEVFKDQNVNLPIIQKQLVNFFINGLSLDYLKMKIMRSNSDPFQGDVAVAMTEQNLRKRFELRRGTPERSNNRHFDGQGAGEESMEVDHYRNAKRCFNCNKIGHRSRDCKARKQVNAFDQTPNFNKEIDYWKCRRRK